MSSLHERAKELFLEVLERSPGDRRRFLNEACQGDTDLLHEVESLLEFHDDDEEPGGNQAGSSTASEFAPGYIFAGRYRMITRIGRGGMGDVWRADDLVLNTTVALKFITSTGPEARARILNEVRLARRITHPAVCRVFDFGEADDKVFFSMEFVGGEDLATVLKRVGRLPSEKVVEIAHQLCAGLAAAHAQRVLHRDLKPANVLIDDEGRVRITDFGIAVVRSDEKHNTMVGTPGYMAPEQLMPGRELTERTDVYTLPVYRDRRDEFQGQSDEINSRRIAPGRSAPAQSSYAGVSTSGSVGSSGPSMARWSRGRALVGLAGCRARGTTADYTSVIPLADHGCSHRCACARSRRQSNYRSHAGGLRHH